MQEPSSNELGLDPANESPFKGKTGLRRVWNALNYSLAGLKAAYLCEDAFRQEVILAVLLIPVAFLLPVPWLGRKPLPVMQPWGGHILHNIWWRLVR